MTDSISFRFLPDAVPEIEDRLRGAGVTVEEFCREAGINRATWQRWKAGKNEPRLTVWRRVVAAVPAGQGARA